MNKKKLLKATIILYAIITCFTLQGCTENKSGIKKGEISSIQADTSVFLKVGNEKSPTCNVTIDFMYLRPSSEEDSLSTKINEHLQRITFGTSCNKLQPEASIKAMRDNYITSYRNELLPYYEADLKNGVLPEEMPGWYNYEYNISSELKIARDSILNYSVTHFENTGGAHPNTFMNWRNINANTGKILTKADVFTKDSDKQIIDLITKQLVAEANKRLETDTITNLQGLWDNGVLLNIDLYVPNNFLITDQGVTFLYNRYDIAPYVFGDFQLNVPYAEIENLMIMK